MLLCGYEARAVWADLRRLLRRHAAGDGGARG